MIKTDMFRTIEYLLAVGGRDGDEEEIEILGDLLHLRRRNRSAGSHSPSTLGTRLKPFVPITAH